MKNISKAVLLELLAEESSELTHAALKLSRIIRGENPTPISYEEAYKNIIEEYTDVIHTARKLSLYVDEEQIRTKDIRWNSRIESMKEVNNE
jgi:hypothetical protein